MNKMEFFSLEIRSLRADREWRELMKKIISVNCWNEWTHSEVGGSKHQMILHVQNTENQELFHVTNPSEGILWKLKFYIHSEKNWINSLSRNSGLKMTRVFIIISKLKYQYVIYWAGYRFLPSHGRYPVFVTGEEFKIRLDTHLIL